MVNFEHLLEEFKKYVEENKTAIVPVDFVCDDGYRLGYEMRKLRKNNASLTDEQKKILSDNGFLWRMDGYYKNFDIVFPLIENYIKEYGDSYIPAKYTINGINLGEVVRNIRRGIFRLNEEQKERLEKIEFEWSTTKRRYSFRQIEEWFKEHKEKYGTLIIPMDFVNNHQIRLGYIANKIREGKYRLSEAEKEILCEMKFPWYITSSEIKFEKLYIHFVHYKDEKKNCNIPKDYICSDGYRLGAVINNIKEGKFRITNEQLGRLMKLGFYMDLKKRQKSFSYLFECFWKYSREHNGVCNIPVDYVSEDGEKIGEKAEAIRSGKIMLNKEQKELLDSINFF